MQHDGGDSLVPRHRDGAQLRERRRLHRTAQRQVHQHHLPGLRRRGHRLRLRLPLCDRRRLQRRLRLPLRRGVAGQRRLFALRACAVQRRRRLRHQRVRRVFLRGRLRLLGGARLPRRDRHVPARQRMRRSTRAVRLQYGHRPVAVRGPRLRHRPSVAHRRSRPHPHRPPRAATGAPRSPRVSISSPRSARRSPFTGSEWVRSSTHPSRASTASRCSSWALGAPPDLLHAAQAAAADEIEHARIAYALASAYAGRATSVRGPSI